MSRVKAADEAVSARILIVDIERQAGLTHIFDQRQSGFIPVSRWTRLPSLLCFAAKWHGKRHVEFHAAWDDRDAMIQRSWELYDQADIVVTYNGKRFDNKWLRSAWRDAGLTPPRTWKDVDLFAVNKSSFGADSYSLAHLCHQLGLPSKSGHYDPVMADLCMDGDTAAQARMRRYNIGDVKITEQAYDRLLPWISNHPHVRTADAETLICPNCGSDKPERAGTYRAVVMDYAQYRCGDCGALYRAGHVRRVARTRGVR